MGMRPSTHYPDTDWNMGEFFVISRFQGSGYGYRVFKKVIELHPGKWEVMVIPENKPAISFWHNSIGQIYEKYDYKTVTVAFDEQNPTRILFRFETNE